jgi:hypothetical protein
MAEGRTGGADGERSRQRLRSAQARIDAQIALVAKLEPGSPLHRKAVSVLLLFQDILHVLTEAHGILAARASDANRADELDNADDLVRPADCRRNLATGMN